MINEYIKTAKQTAIYSLGNLSTKLVGFILLPLYTAHLTTAEYGILNILEAFALISIAVFGLNIPTAMMRWAVGEKDIKRSGAIVYTSLISSILIAVVFLFITLPLNEQFSQLFFNNTLFSEYFLVLSISIALGIINNIPLNLIRLKEKAVFYITLTTLRFLVIVILNIYFIVVLNMGVLGIVISQALGHLAVLIFSIPFVIKNSYPKFDKKIFVEMARYGFPLVFSTIFAMLLSLSDRFIIQFIKGDSSVGLYSLGYKIASIINVFIIQSFQLGFLPIAYKKLGSEDAKRFFSKVLTIYTLVLTISALVISSFGRELLEILSTNKDYWDAAIVIPLISFAFVIRGIQYLFSLSFHFTKKTKFSAYIVMGTAVFNLALNFILIPKYDFYGAAISQLISFIFMALLSLWLGQKVYFIDYEWKRIGKIIVIGLSLYLATSLFAEFSIYLRLAAKSFIILLFLISLLYLKVFTASETAQFKIFISGIFSKIRLSK